MAKPLVRIAGKPLPIVFLAVGIALGHFFTGGGAPGSVPAGGPDSHVRPAAAKAEIWTCSMHPSIRKKGPGQSPLCAMDLALVSDEGDGGMAGPRAFRTSAAAKQLRNVEVAEVERRFVTKEIRMTGKVDFDETRLGYRFPGGLTGSTWTTRVPK